MQRAEAGPPSCRWNKLILMTIPELLSHIESEIARLQRARALLTGDGYRTPRLASAPKKHTMSAEGRARVAAAQRKHVGQS